MTWMNEDEVRGVVEWFTDDTPNLRKAAQALERLMDWTNGCSDGWAYWAKPQRAADALTGILEQAVIQVRRTGEIDDLTGKELERLLAPVRKLLTEHNVDDSDSVLFPPPPPEYRPGIVLTRDQLEAWAGMTLSNGQVELIDIAIPQSSIPEAVAVIAEQLGKGV